MKTIKKTKYDIDNEIIIGYNTKKQKDNPPKNIKKKKQKVTKKSKPETKKRKMQKKKKRKSNIKKILKILLKLVIIVGVFTCIVLFLFVSPVFNIKDISVVGAKEIPSSVYIAMSGIEVGENIFKINKSVAIEEITKQAYVEAVQINSVYPNKVEIVVEERQACYIAESNGRYFYLDKRGYVLNISLSSVDMPQINGISEELDSIEIGGRISQKEFDKFNDLIKIMNAIKNNMINAKLSSIDISDKDNYILEFTEEDKKIMLGDISDLSAKMAWIKMLIEGHKEEKGTVYLNAKDVYFAPNA